MFGTFSNKHLCTSYLQFLVFLSSCFSLQTLEKKANIDKLDISAMVGLGDSKSWQSNRRGLGLGLDECNLYCDHEGPDEIVTECEGVQMKDSD